jgi:AcrR family transcriptional regulator
MSPKPDVSAERKAQILAAASRVFLKKGFDAARMEEIATESGLSIGGVYWYYKSKEDVIFGLMDEITDTDLGDLRALLEAPGSVVERLKSYIRASIPPTEALSPLFYDFYSLGGRDPTVRVRLRDYFRAYRQIIADLLSQGVARGEFRPIEAGRVAVLFAALYEGMLEMAMLDPENVQSIPELIAALEVLFQGLRP